MCDTVCVRVFESIDDGTNRQHQDAAMESTAKMIAIHRPQLHTNNAMIERHSPPNWSATQRDHSNSPARRTVQCE